MKKKGFTLIELLAVIVILAIVALIATPLVLNIIDSTKKKTALQSAELYLSAVEKTIVSEMVSGNKIENGSYEITDKGNICLKQDVNNTCKKEVRVSMKGKVANGGTIQIEDGKVTSATLQIDDKVIRKNGNKLEYVNEDVNIDSTPLYNEKLTYSEDNGAFILDSMVNFESLKSKTNYKLTLTDSNSEETIIDNLSLYAIPGMGGILGKSTEDSTPMLMCDNNAGACLFMYDSLNPEQEYEIQLEEQNDNFILYKYSISIDEKHANMYFATVNVDKGWSFDLLIKDEDNNIYFNERKNFNDSTSELVGTFSYQQAPNSSETRALFNAIRNGKKITMTISYYDLETEQLNGLVDEYVFTSNNAICDETNASNECISYSWGNPNILIID